MGNCKILNCKTIKGERTFFNVPHEPILRSKWIEQIRRHQQFDNIPISYPICDLHFDSTKIVKNGKRTILVKGTLPTMFPNVDGEYSFFSPIQQPNIVSADQEQTEIPSSESNQEEDNKIEQKYHQSVQQNDQSPDQMKAKDTLLKKEQKKQPNDQKQTENEFPNKIIIAQNNSSQGVNLTPMEYKRLLQAEIKAIKYEEIVRNKAHEIRCLQNQLASLKRRVFKRPDLEHVEVENLDDTDSATRKILNCMEFGRDEKSYNEDVRAFCMTLNFYSPRAYKYLRSKFNCNLPSTSTMRNWYASLNASPGFTTESFEVLRKKAENFKQKTGSQILCSLIFDEMAIRRHAQWNTATKKFDGFVDIGSKIENNDNVPLAKDSLVYLISGVDDDFKIPIAYFLTNGLTGAERAALTNEILIRLSEIGIKVVAITFDGLPANLAMCRVFGADFENGKAYFFDPVDQSRKIYVILDPPHMLKLARNCIGTRNLIDGEGRSIEWKYFVLLYEAQKSMPFNLGNKLTKEHMQWDKKKMSVKLAAQTLSDSVADSMQFMKNECTQFVDVDGTIKYIRILNDTFDVMNSTKSAGATQFKRAITKSTAAELFERLEEAKDYFRNLKVERERKSIFSSTVHTPFIGFYNNIINFKSMYEDYVKNDEIDALTTHRFCQDHIETFFGAIRSMGGFNDNPTAQQFEAAYRKLLIHNDVICSNKSNCIDRGTKILTVSSNRSAKSNQTAPDDDLSIDDCSSDFFLNQDYIDSFHVAEYMDDAHSHSIAFIASSLEAKIIRAKPPKLLIKCQDCVSAFIENELIEDSFIRFKARRTNAMQPCRSTFDICKFVDSFIKTCSKNSHQAIMMNILRNIPFETLYTSSNFESHPGEKGHKYNFVKKIIELYMNVKSVHIAKCFTLNSHDAPVRNNFKKLIQEMGQ